MGKIEDEKYTSQEDRNSEVRNIINQLHADRPAQEKSREVVMRSDGTKAVRVVKKRRVVVSGEEKSKRSMRTFVYGILAVLLFLGALTGFFLYRMSRIASDSYMQQLEQKLCQSYGAEQLKLVGASLSGFTLKVDSIVIDFPADCIVSHVEMSDISGTLATSSFFTDVLKMEEVKIKRVSTILKDGVQQLSIPHMQGEPLWDVSRVLCDDFTFQLGEDAEQSPIALEHCAAYMYYPGNSKASRVLIMSGGKMKMRGWKRMELVEAKVQVSPVSLENIRLKATFEQLKSKKDTPESYLLITGNLSDGDSLETPLMMDSHQMKFSEFTADRFSRFFSAETHAVALGKKQPEARVILPFASSRPKFSGRFSLRQIRVTSLPAMMLIVEHIEPTKRKEYLPPLVQKGYVNLRTTDESMEISFSGDDVRELDLITLRGRFVLSPENELSGSLEYGIPAHLTHVEYPDSIADPIFHDDGVMAWVTTTLSGVATAPTDNIHELDVKAEAARASRPARVPFDVIDVDAFSEQMLKQHENAGDNSADSTEASSESGQSSTLSPNNGGNPFIKKGNDVFAPSNPFDSGTSNPFESDLTKPADKSVFPY